MDTLTTEDAIKKATQLIEYNRLKELDPNIKPEDLIKLVEDDENIVDYTNLLFKADELRRELVKNISEKFPNVPENEIKTFNDNFFGLVARDPEEGEMRKLHGKTMEYLFQNHHEVHEAYNSETDIKAKSSKNIGLDSTLEEKEAKEAEEYDQNLQNQQSLQDNTVSGYQTSHGESEGQDPKLTETDILISNIKGNLQNSIAVKISETKKRLDQLKAEKYASQNVKNSGGGGGGSSLFGKLGGSSGNKDVDKEIKTLEATLTHEPLMRGALEAIAFNLTKNLRNADLAAEKLDNTNSNLNVLLESHPVGQKYLERVQNVSEASGLSRKQINDLLYSQKNIPNTPEWGSLQEAHKEALDDIEIRGSTYTANLYHKKMSESFNGIQENMGLLTDNGIPAIDADMQNMLDVLDQKKITNSEIADPVLAPIHNSEEEKKKMMERISETVKNIMAMISKFFGKR